MNPATEPWNLDELAEALASFDRDKVETLVGGWLAADIDQDRYVAAAEACAAWRYHGLAAAIFEAAWRRGSRPYDAAYAVEMTWRACGDATTVAREAERVAVQIRSVTFRQEGDAFHVDAAGTILANIAALARIEEGEFVEIAPQSLHSFAVSALWRRIWTCHSSLQSTKAQRLARCCLEVVSVEAVTRLQALFDFFGLSGEAVWASEQLRKIGASDPLWPIAAALRMAIAYEAELTDEFHAALQDIESIDLATGGHSPEALAAVASGRLYAAFSALADGSPAICLHIVAAALAEFGSEPWAGLFLQPRGMAIEAQDRSAAVECYAAALGATGAVRSPFLTDVAGDAAAAEGRWDVAYEYFERRAASMRPLYAALVPDWAGIDTRSPETLQSEAVLLSGWGVGDDVIAYGLLRRHFPDATFTVALDHRLVRMAKRAHPGGEFLPQAHIRDVGATQYWRDRQGVPESVDFLRCTTGTARVARQSGALILQEDLAAIHAARSGRCPAGAVKPILGVDPDRVESMREWTRKIAGGGPCFAIGWRSGLRTKSRAQTFLHEEQVAKLMREAPASWVLLQYDWDPGEVERIEAAAGARLAICPGLDLKHDLEGVAALSLACDLVFCTGVATRDIAAAAGAKVVSLHHGRINAEAWRRDAAWRDVIFPDMLHTDPAGGGDGVIAQAIEIARSWRN